MGTNDNVMFFPHRLDAGCPLGRGPKFALLVVRGLLPPRARPVSTEWDWPGLTPGVRI